MDLPHPVLLRTFLAVAETRSFTQAAERLGLRQSTVSQHVKRLETDLARRLFARDTHSVALTPDGDALIGFARGVLEANGRLERFVTGSALRGRLRFGASEDFAFSALPDVLAEFADVHPSIDLELTVGLSGLLYERFDAGELDLILVKRRAGDDRGMVAWREQTVWLGRAGIRPDPAQPLPLVLYPPPSITRRLALDALEKVGRSWRVACTSSSLAGLRAAALAGLGLMPHSARLVPPGLVPIPASRHLPALGIMEFVAIGPGPQEPAAAALTAMILSNASRLQKASG
jgi:DNA-binding transcriptional LysR family regulator